MLGEILVTEKQNQPINPSENPTESTDAPETIRRGPPVQVSEEVLNERGLSTLSLAESIIGKSVTSSGGREDLPWLLINPSQVSEIANKFRDDSSLQMDLLHCLFAVDYIGHIELNYILFSIQNNRKLILKVHLDPEMPSIKTITHLWTAAAWYERETHDLFGVKFEGNDDLEPLLLYEGFEGYPGLKSFPLHDYKEY